MNRFNKVKDYLLRVNSVKTEIRSYTKQEKKEIESRKMTSNTVRIQVLSIIIFTIELLHLTIRLVTGYTSTYAQRYIVFGIAILLAIALHEVVYFLWIKKWIKKDTVKGSAYVLSWYVCFTVASILYLSLKGYKQPVMYDFFACVVVISMIPLISTKIQMIYTGALLLAQLILLLFRDATFKGYKLSCLVVFAAFVIGRILYVNFIRMSSLKFRLKETKKELETQSTRFSILQDLTKETIFEYSFREDKMIIINSRDNEKQIIYNYIEKLKHQYHSVDNMDVREAINAYRELIYGKKRDKIEFEYKDENGNVKHSKALFTTIYEGKNPLKLIGKVCNIDE